MLDIECFSFLNRKLEEEMAPIVIMASNRGMAKIRGTNYSSPHGLPVDLLDRVLIISTRPYAEEDIEQIIRIRCQEEDVTLTDQAIGVLTSMAMQTTMRYALQLISSADVIAKRRRSNTVDIEDLRKCYIYFNDEKRSVQWLKEQQGSLVFNEQKADDAMQY